MPTPRFLRGSDFAYRIPRMPGLATDKGILNYPQNPWTTSWYYWLRRRGKRNARHPKLLTVVCPTDSRFHQDGSFGGKQTTGPDFNPTPLKTVFTKKLHFGDKQGHSLYAGNYLLHNCNVWNKNQLFTQYRMFDFGFCTSDKENNYNILCMNCTYHIPPAYSLSLFHEDKVTLDLDHLYSPCHRYFSASNAWIDSPSMLPLSTIPKRK